MTWSPDQYLDVDRVSDVFCDGIAAIDRCRGDCIRLTFYANRTIAVDETERHVVARLVLSREVLLAAGKQLALVEAGKPFLDNAPAPDGREAKDLN